MAPTLRTVAMHLRRGRPMVPGLVALLAALALGRSFFWGVSWLEFAGLTLLVLSLAFASLSIVSLIAKRSDRSS